MAQKKIYISLLSFLFVALSFCDAHDEKKPLKAAEFDYHDVVVDRKPLVGAKCFGKLYMRHMFDGGIYVGAARSFWQRLTTESEDVSVDSLLRDIPEWKPYYDEIYECVDAMDVPNQDVISFIKKLRAKGVTVIVASNMHKDTFEHNKKSKKEVFDLFDRYFISGKANGKKPAQIFYERLRKKSNKKLCNNDAECIRNMKRVFIDDKKENVEGYKKFDPSIKGFVFNKNVQELEEFLKKENFLSADEKA